MKTVIVVEYGSGYFPFPYEVVGVFESEELADEYINSHKINKNRDGVFTDVFRKTEYIY